ncbi:MAG: MYXO-CTERM sorting domain-containing protein [Myxococcota bacterium]|nr:MYXO-CTERM sorting domain-containing protein [Myxococcota bacterium]
MLTHSVLATLAAFSACTDLPVPVGDITSPQAWGDAFLAKYAEERVIGELEPGPPPLAQPRTVLLITGVTIPAVWFDPIVARLERDGFRPVVYEPPDLLSGDLFEHSHALAAVVERVRAESGEDKIDILAECTGGLIARHYIQALGGDQYVSRLVTFISPQRGLPKASLAAGIVGWPALDDLTPGSEFLETVNSAPLPAAVAVTSIYTCTDEYIQPYKTSIIPGATNIGLCDGFVGHFQFFYDPAIYLVMHGALVAPVAADPDGPADGDPAAPASPTDGGGCAVGGGSTGGAGLLALGALLVRLRRRRS